MCPLAVPEGGTWISSVHKQRTTLIFEVVLSPPTLKLPHSMLSINLLILGFLSWRDK